MDRNRLARWLLVGWGVVTLWLAGWYCWRVADRGKGGAPGVSVPVIASPGVPGYTPKEGATEEPQPVCVIWDDRLVASDAKLSYSRARNVYRLLQRAGMRCGLFPVSRLELALSEPCRVAHLVLLHSAGEEEISRLKGFCEAGGQLVVQGSQSLLLMRFFGIAPRDRTLSMRKDDWIGYSFARGSGALAGLPSRIRNTAPMVLDLRAERTSVRAVSYWENAQGVRNAGNPVALFEGPYGFWIARALYEEGSLESREQMLAVLTGAKHPELWEEAAERLRSLTWERLGAQNPDAAEKRLLQQTEGESRRQAVRDGFARLRVREKQVLRGRAAAEAAREVFRESQLIYAAALLPKPGTFRRVAAWMNADLADQMPDGGGWPAVADALARAGITDLLLQAGSCAWTETPISGIPASASLRRLGDPFPAAIQACHSRGIRVHAWLAIGDFHGATSARRRDYETSGRLLHSSDGGTIAWLNPAHPDNCSEWVKIVSNLAKIPDLDGISLDFFRYPEQSVLEKKDPEAVTKLLARLSQACGDKIRSVAVFGSYPRSIEFVGQDWQAWLDAGLVDWVLPMNYAPNCNVLRWIAKQQTRNRERLVSGIGIHSNEAMMDVVEMVDQLRFLQNEGYGGVSFFLFDVSFLREKVPALEAARAVGSPHLR